MLAGEVAGLGSTYVITRNAEESRTGDSLAREQVEAECKEKVLRALGKAASRLRRKLGDDARHPRYIFTEPQVGYRMPRS